MLYLKIFLKEIEHLQKDSANKKYLLAVSGGADSMAMLDLFNKSKFNFQVAHINYKLRGEASDLDQKLVKDFCKFQKIPFHGYGVSKQDAPPKNSIQNWARKLRYQFFRKIQQQENLEFLITAHHLNDDLETFIINLSRGSGLNGLSGIPDKKNNILRPFLKFSKDEIYQYCKENKVLFREDNSNTKSDYLRNRIRNEVVPRLLETNASFLNNFQKSLHYLQQNKSFIKNQIAIIEEQLIKAQSLDKIIYDKNDFEKQDGFIQFEILRKFGFDESQEIRKIFLAETGKSFYSKKYQLLINRNELIIRKKTINKDEFEEIEVISSLDLAANKIIDLKKIILENTKSYNSETSFYERVYRTGWNFDCEKLVFPIKIRHRKGGDLFHPLQMSGRKKVSKYFKDEKISLLDKEEIWILADGNDEVLGIIPFRQDRRFAADQKTLQSIKFVF